MQHLKIIIATVLMHAMCFSVVLSHTHAKDVTALFSGSHSSVKTLSSSDITGKALSDLHHHIDKAAVKNIHAENTVAAARTRELNPLSQEITAETLSERIHDFMLRLRVVGSLCFARI